MSKTVLISERGNSIVREADGAPGTAHIKIIKPGMGSSGHYTAELLQRIYPIFEGVQMFWNHPKESDQWERPERNLEELAAVLNNVYWDENGVEGAGIYGSAVLFSPFRESLKELAPYIGVSLLGSGIIEPTELDGDTVPVVKEITYVRSVDFVTLAGAGGKIVELFESVRNKHEDRNLEPIIEVKQEEVKSMNEKTLEDLQKELKETKKTNAELQAQNAKLQRAATMAEISAKINESLADESLSELTKTRIVETVLSKFKLSDDLEYEDGDLTKCINSVVESEKKYITSITGKDGTVEDLGVGEIAESKTDTKSDEVFDVAMSRIRKIS